MNINSTMIKIVFSAVMATALTSAILKSWDPKTTDATISVTNANFGVASFTVRGDGLSVNRMAAAIACVNGEIPWTLKPLAKLVDDKIAIIRKLEERVAVLESRTKALDTRSPGVITLPTFHSTFEGTKVY